MNKKHKGIGILPQRLPEGAVPDSCEHEDDPFTADPNSPHVQRLAELIGWDKVREIAANEAEALRQKREGSHR